MKTRRVLLLSGGMALVACGDSVSAGPRGLDAATGSATGIDADPDAFIAPSPSNEAGRETGVSVPVSGAEGGTDDAPSSDASADGKADADAPVVPDAGLDAAPRVGPDAAPLVAADGGAQPASTFRCGNWADMRDNFVNGNLQLSGLSSTTDTYATVTAKTDSILAGFQTIAGGNAVRIPINEPTALGPWWGAYKGIIDAAAAKGVRVLVAYWAWHNGKPDDLTQFFAMWDAVVNAYANNDLVYFQIHNEPFGYSGVNFINLAVQWLARYPGVPTGRVIVAGTGYDGDVLQQGADTRLKGTLLSLHIYPFSNSSQTSTQAWRTAVQGHLGGYANRTIVTEWGAPMTQGTDYSGPGDGNNNTSFMTGLSGYLHDNAIGSCYWPLLRDGDAWSLTTRSGTGTSLSLTVTNASGLARVKSAFGL